MPAKKQQPVAERSRSRSNAAAASGKPDPYVAPEYSILMEYVLNPFYTFVANFYPSWWSPNGITCTVVASLLFFTDAVNPVTNDPATGLPRTAAGFDFLYDVRPTSLRSYDAAHGGKKNAAPAAEPTKPAVGKDGKPVVDNSKPAAATAVSKDLVSLPAAMLNDRSLDSASFVDVNNSNSWVFILCGLLNWIYIIADNTDGKHARRFKQSSLIGEYLDHGLDTVTALLTCFVIGAVAGERIAIGFLLQLASSVMMVCSHFHHLDKNVFIWGDRLFSVDEAMVIISSYPLVVGLFPSAQTAFVVFTAVRFVQAFYLVFACGTGSNILKFIWTNPRIVKPSVNPLFLIEIALLAAMTFWGVYHQGGMLDDVQFESKAIIATLSPYLSWGNGNDHFGSFPVGKSATGGAAVDTMPIAVRALYQAVVMLCPPYLLRVIGSRVIKLLVTYPAVWCITTACVTSTLVHIPISAKCFKEKKMNSYMPLAGALLATYAFGVSPVSGMLLSVAWHVGQILINCMQLQARAK